MVRPDEMPDLPALPGCYIFRGADGTPLYVGKARSLRSRVRNYFQDPARLTPRTRAMVQRARSVETVTTSSDVEALLLESTLIKRYRPRFNIVLRDDKTYPYLKITAEPFPRLLLVRRVRSDGGEYFGPYPNVGSVRDTLRMLRRLFPMRTCSPYKFQTVRRPCLEYHIHRCPAPCVGLVDAERYGEMVEGVRLYLRGRNEELRRRLRREMEAEAAALRFERAAEVRDLMRGLDQLAERQEVVRLSGSDEDYVGLARRGRLAALCLIQVRAGKLMGKSSFFMTADPERLDGEVVGAFLDQYYPMAAAWPREVLVPTLAFPGVEQTTEYLRRGRENTHGARLHVPVRGDKRRLLELAMENANLAVTAEDRREAARGQPLEELRRALNLPRLPERIEGYDISNFQGRDSVSSMVVFEGGCPAKAEYRRFVIRTVEGADDFASHAETARRRFGRGLEESRAVAAGELPADRAKFARMPDLVLIDGGRGQLNAVRKVMHELGLGSIPTLGLAKEEELVFMEGNPDPIRLPRGGPALTLLQAVRDEAHRFAITHHRSRRDRSGLRSRLDGLPGLGPVRRRRLLARFGSVRGVAEQSVADLVAAGLPRPVAERVHGRLHAPDTPPSNAAGDAT